MARAQWEYTLRQAGELAGVSVDTIKRRLRAGDLPHARQMGDPAKTWVVPLGDLVSAGFTIKPVRSLQGQNSSPERIGSSPLEVRAAVAEAVGKVHAEYAQALGELAAAAIAALGAQAGQVTLPTRDGESADASS